MGEYTEYHKLYKSDSDELVDVDNQLNYNLERLDFLAKTIADYLPTDVQSVQDNFDNEPGHKFYKYYSNSFWYYHPETRAFVQDVNGDVDGWSSSGISFQNGFKNYDSDRGRVGYKTESNESMCRWRGQIILNDFDNIDRNTHYTVMTLPSETIPSNSRYFFTHSGFGSGAVTYRLMFQEAGELQVIRYGPTTQSTSAERYISLVDVSYPLDDGNEP